MDNGQNIRFLMLANVDNNVILYEHTVVKMGNTEAEAKQIFSKIRDGERNLEQRNKIQARHGCYYFIVTAPNTFYIALVDTAYPERFVYELIDKLNKDNVPIMVDNQGQLNSPGIQIVKTLVEKYQNVKNLNNITAMNDSLNDIKLEMNKNIKATIANVKSAEELEDQSNRIKDNAAVFRTNARDLQRLTWWQNCKWIIIIALLVIIVLLAILLPILL